MKNSPIDKALKRRKNKLMKLLGMKEWGVLNLALLNEEDNKKAWKLLSEIEQLQRSKLVFDDMEKTLDYLIEQTRKGYSFTESEQQ